VIAAEVGHLDLAYAYWAETALTDLRDLHGNTGGGLHIAALAGAWTVAVAGFGGMRDHGGRVTFAPRLPAAVSRLSFRLNFLRRCLLVDIRADAATYDLLAGDDLQTSHYGETLTLTAGVPVTRPIPPPPAVEPVAQPPGCGPLRRQ
jgi:alpha,alpha-trehalose phosphorylase